MERNYNTFAKRLDFMLREANISKIELSELLDIHRTTVYWWLSGKNAPKGQKMRRVEQVFSNYSPNWINFGRGEMYKESSNSNTVERLEQIIRDKDKMIKLLEEKIEMLQK